MVVNYCSLKYLIRLLREIILCVAMSLSKPVFKQLFLDYNLLNERLENQSRYSTVGIMVKVELKLCLQL